MRRSDYRTCHHRGNRRRTSGRLYRSSIRCTDAFVELRADHAPRRLHHLLQTGVQVHVFVAIAKTRVHRAPHLFVDLVHLRQAQRCDKSADQLLPDQIDTFRERAAEHRKSHTVVRASKPREKRVAGRFVHARFLRPDRQSGMTLAHQRDHLLQVIETAQETQVITGLRDVLLCNQIHDGIERPFAVAPARRHVAGDMHL